MAKEQQEYRGALHKNGDGTYTISKGLFNIVIGVFLAAALGVLISIVSWWNGFAAFQTEMRQVATKADHLDAWYRSGEPSTVAKLRFEEMEKQHARMQKQIDELHSELSGRIDFDRSSRKGVIP